jgi:hypothetical protein
VSKGTHVMKQYSKKLRAWLAEFEQERTAIGMCETYGILMELF